MNKVESSCSVGYIILIEYIKTEIKFRSKIKEKRIDYYISPLFVYLFLNLIQKN